MAFSTLICVILNLHAAAGLFLRDGPCYIYPRFPVSANWTSDVTTSAEIPSNCKNGTFYWDYPRGHVMVHYFNNKRMETQICFGDGLGGNVFTIVDLTQGANYTLPHFERNSKKKACTHVSQSPDIQLRIDAPETQYYMGAMIYTIDS